MNRCSFDTSPNANLPSSESQPPSTDRSSTLINSNPTSKSLNSIQVLKNPPNTIPPCLQITFDKDFARVKKNHDMLNHSLFNESGIMPPVLRPLKCPSVLNTVCENDFPEQTLTLKPNFHLFT